jgi:hypothetical protein
MDTMAGEVKTAGNVHLPIPGTRDRAWLHKCSSAAVDRASNCSPTRWTDCAKRCAMPQHARPIIVTSSALRRSARIGQA